MAARGSGLAYEPAALRRVKRTPPQASLTRKEREVNLNGAFTVPRPGRVRGKGVLLVDDVFTTGATAAACARALLDAGASTVKVLTLARTA
jgi:predicted amidophosphoribosyltransferase